MTNSAVQVVSTRQFFDSDGRSGYVRLVRVGGILFLQMQGRRYSVSPYTWYDGVLMVCPEDTDLDYVVSAPHVQELYYRGYAPGCMMSDVVFPYLLD